MERWPRVSIVTPWVDPEEDLAATIESVRVQGYPAVEHIVVLGPLRGGGQESLERLPRLTLLRGTRSGHAGAINQGFEIATGQVWGHLGAGYALAPGAVERVIRELIPERGRHVVMGRCRLVDEQGSFVGLDDPGHFESVRCVLEAWNGGPGTPPALFWTPEVWRACGPMDESLAPIGASYDLFCRISRTYCLHRVDEVLLIAHLAAISGTVAATAGGHLEEIIRISRRYWRSPLTLAYWRLVLSLTRFRFHRVGRARAHLRLAQERWRLGEKWGALPPAAAGALLGPEVAFHVGLYPRVRDRGGRLAKRVLARLGQCGAVSPLTAAHLDRAER